MTTRQETVWVIKCDGAACVQWERGRDLPMLADWCKRTGWTAVGDNDYCPAHETRPLNRQ